MLARSVGLNPAHTLQRVDELCTLLREHAQEARDRVAAMPAGGHELLERVQAEIVHAAQIIERQLTRGRGAIREGGMLETKNRRGLSDSCRKAGRFVPWSRRGGTAESADPVRKTRETGAGRAAPAQLEAAVDLRAATSWIGWRRRSPR